MHVTRIVALFSFLASGALSMPAQAENAGAPAMEVRAPADFEGRSNAHASKGGSGSASAAAPKTSFQSPEPFKVCDVHLARGEGYLEAKDYYAQAKSLCAQLQGIYPGRSRLTAAVRCTRVPAYVPTVGKVTAVIPKTGNKTIELLYSCLGQ
ncbi:uncharacterized protein PpBr36_06754 [Pyricularia pennisetigena]|uniref:uncharacterized protein n=1 Tax=Pyricularia pennisetigena TaxID=1578925 RepID=UPI001150FCAA|nr:uncharacterized protein PpBr36_06754 [Pyricularia pennisetigena]TLS23055.1 hypothetical protein PpBr36_06754 [Pyricularia pennisetigena]